MTPQQVEHRRRGRRRPAGVALAATLALAGPLAVDATATAAPPPSTSWTDPDFGPNVTIFDPGMPVDEIEAVLDATFEAQRHNEMGTDRFSYLFLPGSYGTADNPLQFGVGYYTEIAGLGADPGDVDINGKIEVYNRCLEDNGTANCIALNNFWRTLSNLSLQINGAGQDGCRASANFWAVSQAVSVRRFDVTGGNLSLMDYCTAGPQWASGGFIADTRAGVVINGSQQQWLTRNSVVGEWTNAVWNQVFAGVEGAPSDATFPDPPYTTLETTPISREKPFLYVDDAGRWFVRVPAARTDTRGISWDEGMTAGRSIPITEFFLAKPGDSEQVINNQLARGKHIIFTPGVYDIDRTIAVKRPNTVVLGMGHATLTAAGGSTPLTVADVPGVVLAGITIDAGSELSDVLLQIGKPNGPKSRPHVDPANPTTLSDVYFRVGGPHIGKTKLALEVNSDNVLIDHTWVWRGDHGVEGFEETGTGFLGDDLRWETNIGTDGVIVNGDNVTATGLFVEHFQRYNTVWNGENGTVVLYQNELPYDPPTQADWTQPDGTLGYPGYKVADHVGNHTLYGAGVYVYNRNDPSIVTENGFEAPDKPGVRLIHIMTVNLQAGTILHVIDGIGDPVTADASGIPEYLVEYPLP